MGRPKKTKISLTPDSLRTLLQEIYNDCNSQKRKTLEEMLKRNELGDDEIDKASLGKLNNDSLKIINGVIEKKLALAKLQSQYLNKAMTESEESEGGLNPEDIKSLRDMMLKGDNSDDTIEFKLND